MEQARKVVAEESEREFPHLRNLPDDVRQVFDRHCESLAALALSLREAGQRQPAIRELVNQLLRQFEKDLVATLEAPQ